MPNQKIEPLPPNVFEALKEDFWFEPYIWFDENGHCEIRHRTIVKEKKNDKL